MAPLLRRTWAPCGQTPIILQRGRTFQKISMIAALAVAPQGQRVSLYFSLYSNANVTARRASRFLSLLRRQLRNTLVVLWDRAQIHRARSVALAHPNCRLAYFPAYAPELNPVEIFWSYLKKNPLANFAPSTLPALATRARYHSTKLRHRTSLLRSFLHATPLF